MRTPLSQGVPGTQWLCHWMDVRSVSLDRRRLSLTIHTDFLDIRERVQFDRSFHSSRNSSRLIRG